jgi:NAD(P)-dependent dehydrogenase (short-subunit alcohol dehydrogenase family)
MTDATDTTEVRRPAELFSLDGKVVVLTGASSGLGARWAPALAAAGAQVVLAARREAELAAVASGIAGAMAVPTDITSGADRARLVDATIERFGRIDVLVNNAGTAVSAPALETTIDDFRHMLDTDLTSVFALTQLVGQSMVANGRGSVVNIASLAAERTLDRYPLAAYTAAKTGLVGLTRALASEWGRFGVRVNAVGPAFFPTRLSGFLEDTEQVAWIEEHTALCRPARLDELDGTIVFLAGDASSYVTGQLFLVDGGWSVY